MCNSCNTKVRRHRLKLAGIKYLGGKCIECGYKKSPAALQYHHKDPLTKTVTVGNNSFADWEKLKLELDKCELLCANCHACKHYTRDEEQFLAVVANYKGKSIEL